MTYSKPKVKAPQPELIAQTKEILERFHTNTICIESACPNIGECFARKSATFLILGNICTRKCHFCNVTHGKPLTLDPTEPQRVAAAINQMKLRYVVITSVDRDDLGDGGAGHFAKVVEAIKQKNPSIKVEVLTPDFKGSITALQTIIEAEPFKLAHNIETVKRLAKKIMPGCSYTRSLKVLKTYAKSGITTKSSLMVGLGESIDELQEAFEDLAEVGVSELTIGQYLAPSPAHAPVVRYYSQEEFAMLADRAKDARIEKVVSGILVRSSYYADTM